MALAAAGGGYRTLSDASLPFHSNCAERERKRERERERERFIRIKQTTKRDMPIKPGAYCLATYQ